MKSKLIILMALIGAATFGSLVTGCTSDRYGEHHRHQYSCSMHPEVVQDHAGTCPKCGMALTHTK